MRAFAVIVLLLAVLAGGCRDANRAVPSACRQLAYTCEAGAPGSVRVSTVAARGGGAPGPRALGVGNDIVLENDRIVAVIDALESPHLLAPTGGALLDLAPVGGADELNQLSQVAGILPDDAFHYTSMEIIDESPTLVAVVLRGTLDGRPDVKVATRWEVRPCEPGVRVRSQLYNGSSEPFAFFVSDVSYWGGRGPIPFAPLPGQGYLQPDLDLVTLDSWGQFPYVAAGGGGGTAYALIACERDVLEGVNDDAVTAVGVPRLIVGPGEDVTHERFVITGAGPGVEQVVRLAREARAQVARSAATVTLTGRVVAPGAPAASTAPVSVVASGVRAGELPIPWTEVATRIDDTWTMTVPLGPARIDVWAFGRVVSSTDVDVLESATLPDLTIAAPARLTLTVRDPMDAPIDAMVIVVPADAATREAARGTQHGRLTECTPWLGRPHGASPACNRVLVRGAATVDVPAGHWFVYASAGPFWTLARQELIMAPGDETGVDLLLAPLPGVAAGLVSADLHVHGMGSFDSSLPDEDRVLSFVTAGVDVVAATDHDVVRDYRDTIDALGVGGRIAVMAGVETTGLIPFLQVPGDSFPRVIGHYNFWPVVFDPAAPRGGAPWDELIEPGALFDLMGPLMPDHGVMMLNHPWDDPQFGRDLGYLRAVGYDPRLPIPALDDGTPQGMLARRPAGGHGNMEFDLLEVLNGDSITKFLQYRQIWWALLNDGRPYVGAANSDSHSLADSQLGWPRNLVSVGAGPFDEETFDRALLAGATQGGYGIVIDATIGGVSYGLAPVSPAAGATLDVEIRAAPWIPVDEVRFVVNGAVVRTELVMVAEVADPFGVDETVRWTGSVPLTQLLPAGGGDAWILIEAGLPLPPVGDMDDDGMYDTSDNDGDDAVDQRDVEAGEDSGPLDDPEDPLVEAGDPRFHVTVVAPGTWPVAFTNPWLIDGNGDGVWAP